MRVNENDEMRVHVSALLSVRPFSLSLLKGYTTEHK